MCTTDDKQGITDALDISMHRLMTTPRCYKYMEHISAFQPKFHVVVVKHCDKLTMHNNISVSTTTIKFHDISFNQTAVSYEERKLLNVLNSSS
jgi:hypothetical protein